jgi:predicted RNA binding protein YcfA (HicA-like mRNA interferase family)
MLKLRLLKQIKVINILLKNGFKEVRRGKHITFKKYLPNGEVLTTWVPVPYHSEISVFVLQYIIKQTRKSKEEFL